MTPNFPNPSGPAALPSPDVHFHDYMSVIMRRRRTFFVVFCAVFFGVALYTFAMKPIYEATATLHVRDEKSGKGDLLGELGISRQNPVDTEIEILKSRTNAEQVVKRLHLDWGVSKKSRGLAFTLQEFMPAAGRPWYKIEVTGPDSYAVKDDGGAPVGSGRSGVLLQGKGITLLIGDLRGKPGDSFYLSPRSFNGTVGTLRKAIKAAEVGNKTSIMRLSYSDTDPQRASDVVNTLAQVYLEQSVSFKTQEASKSVDFIEEQMNGVRGELDTAEKNLQAYKSASGMMKLDTEAEELVKKISEVEKERAAAVLQRKQAEFAVAALRDAVKRGKVYTPSVMKEDTGMTAMASRLADLEMQKRALLAESTEVHPQVRALQVQIDEVQKKILATYETSQKNLARQEVTVNQLLAGYEGELRKLPAAERDLARLMRHAKVNADIYTFLLQKHEEARIAKASTISNINIIDPAIVPQTPVKPNKQKNLLLGLLVGLMLAVGIAFFQEYLDDTIKDAEGARLAIGAPVLATIPFLPHREEQTSKGQRSLVAHLDPKSQVSEAFRSLRTSLHFSAINREKKLLLITSTFPGEGKTTTIANLAVTMVQGGARVLLMDCDLRRPALHTLFGNNKVPGVSEILAGDTTIEEAVHDTGIEGLDFISAGTNPPNPSELLGSEKMGDILAALRERYDHILIDAPPVLAVTDAPLLTTRCDMVVVLLETERVPFKAAQRMAEMLANVRAPVAGVVVNDKSGRSHERYGYYGYYGYGYYGYGYYGEERNSRTQKRWWQKYFRRK